MRTWIWLMVGAALVMLVVGLVGHAFEALPKSTREVVGVTAFVLFLLYLAGGIGYWVFWPLVAGP